MDQESEKSDSPLDVVALAYRYLDRDLSSDHRQMLNNLLRHDPDSRSAFVQCLLHTVELEELLPEELAAKSLRKADAGKPQFATMPSPAVEPSVAQRIANSVLTADRGIKLPYFAAAMLLAVLVTAEVAMWTLKHHGAENAMALQHPAPPPAARPRVTHATLVTASNCRWDRTRSTADLAGGGLEPGQSLHLLEGIAEIKSSLLSGGEAQFQIEGPSAMTLSDDGMPNILFGRLTGTFACRGDSFRLGTSLGHIVVAGDSFLGLRSEANVLELHVFSGSATLDLWSASIAGDSNQLLKVAAGDSVKIHSDEDGVLSIEHGDAVENRFITPNSLAASQLIIPEAYVRAVLDAKPVAYWRFEQEDRDGLVRNEVSDRFPLRMSGNAVRLKSANNTRSAEFGMATGPGFMMTDEVFDGAIGDDYTVELWAKPTCFHHGAVFSLIDWSPAVSPKGQHRVYLEFCGPRQWDFKTPGGIWQSDPGRLFFINRRTEVYSSSSYKVRTWQHLVAMRKDSNMTLYADGKVVVTSRNEEPLGAGMRVLIGQLFPPSAYIRDDVTARLYSGELDELALYPRALSEEEVLAHLSLIATNDKSAPSEQ